MKATSVRRIAAVTAALVFGFLAIVAQANPSGKWRIKFNSSADADGVIVFRIAPVGGEPIDVETKIPGGTTENKVASLVRDSLTAALGKGYKVSRDDFEDVVIKKTGKTPKFEVSLASSTLTGLDINVK